MACPKSLLVTTLILLALQRAECLDQRRFTHINIAANDHGEVYLLRWSIHLLFILFQLGFALRGIAAAHISLYFKFKES